MSITSDDIGIEGEAPVNPYSLLEAVNASSRSASTAWWVFLGLCAYLLVAVAAVTHKDLLLARDVALPVLNARLSLTGFFLAAPAVLLIAHFAILTKLVVLARQSLELDTSLRMVEATNARTHPLRLELDSFFLVQAIAGPERSRVVGTLLHGIGWLSLGVLPVAALLYIQSVFLPFHDTATTAIHRGLVAADLVMLALIAAFFARPERSLRQAIENAFRQSPVRSGLATAAGVSGAALAFLVMTVPGAPTGEAGRGPAAADAAPIFFGLVARNLVVTDVDLAGEAPGAPPGRRLNFRGRDLRFARLDRSRLAHADLTGARLDGASLVGVDLSGIELGCPAMHRSAPHDEGTPAAGCASARAADFSGARLVRARLDGLDGRAARFTGAELNDASLQRANLASADFAGAMLDKADLGEATLAGSNLSLASLVGTDLSHATLTGSDLTKATLRAAVLNGTALEGAVLRNVDLEAASLFRARLFAADLTGARIRAASLREAHVWQARTPEGAESALADVSGLDTQIPSPEERETIARAVEQARGTGAVDVLERLRHVDISGEVAAASQTAWRGFAQASDDATSHAVTVIGSLVPTGSQISGTDQIRPADQSGGLPEQLQLSDRRARLTRHLVEMACNARASDGAVATGLARRAIGPGFNADPGVLLESFRRSECVGGRAMGEAVLDRLTNAVDQLSPR